MGEAKRMSRWLVLSLTAVLGLAALLAIDNYYRYQIRQENGQQIAARTALAKEGLEKGIDQRILIVEDLRAFLLASPTMPDRKTFDRYAAIVCSYSPEVRALQYVDTNHIIRYIYPLEGNEAALNLDLMTRSAAPFVTKAVTSRMTTVGDPTTIVQGSLSIVVRSPLYDGDRYLGLAQGVIDVTSLLGDISENLTPSFDIRLKDVHGNIFLNNDGPLYHPLSTTVKVGDNRWELILGSTSPGPEPEFYTLSLIWGLGGALLLSVLFITNQTFRQMAWLSTAVEKKTAELAASEARYRTLVEDADDVILLTDMAGRHRFRNKAYYTSLGLKEGEEGDVDGLALVHPKDQPMLEEQLRELLATGAVTAEYRVRHKVGHWIHRYSRFKLIKNDQGEPQWILVIARDITERKQAEKAIEFQAHLLNTVEQAVVATDTAGRVTYWNRFAEKLYGWSAAEAIGQDVLEITPTGATREQSAEIIASLQQGHSWSGELLLQRKDGSFFSAAVTSAPVYKDEGELVGMVGVSSDISERKRAEEERAKLEKQFRQAQKMEAVGQLTAGIAHDFNNLILIINGNAQLMQMQLDPEDPLYEMTDTIVRAGSRAADLIRQLLIFSRRQVVTPGLVDLNALLTDLNRMLERIIGDNIEIKLKPATNLWPIKTDPNQMEQVVINLAVNARDAMPEGGVLVLETANVPVDAASVASYAGMEQGEYVLLSVSDSGTGMSREVQDHLFEPFFTTKAVGEGSGLGLAMVYGIVIQSGGHIDVHSEPGQGTTFTIYLPRREA